MSQVETERMSGSGRGEARFSKLAIRKYNAQGFHIQQPAENLAQSSASDDESSAVSLQMKSLRPLPLVRREPLSQFRQPVRRSIEWGSEHVNLAVRQLQVAGSGVPEKICRSHALTAWATREASPFPFARSRCLSVAPFSGTICP